MNNQEKINYIKTNFPMIVLLKKLNILPSNFNSKYRFPCPIHQGLNPTTCHINDNNNIHCWKCCRDFDIIDVYKEIRGITNFNDAVKKILNFMHSQKFEILTNKEKTNTSISSNPFKLQYHPPKPHNPIDETEINIKKTQLFKEISPLFNQIRDYYNYLLTSNQNDERKIGLDYLTQKRQLNLETIKEFKLGYAPLSNKPLSFRLINFLKKKNVNIDKLVEYGFIKEKTNFKGKKYYHDTFHGSIIIPIENGYAKTFHFYQNHFCDTSYFQPKYQSLNNFSQTPTFHFSYRFFEAFPCIKQTKIMIVHEGFFDVISCWQNGIKNVVGLICVTQLFSQTQIDILKKENIKIIIALDNDETGKKRSELLGEQLKKENIIYEIRHILPPYNQTCKDVDDLFKQYGIQAYQKCFLDPYISYEAAKKKQIVDLAIYYFGKDKVEVINE
ncbi:DNA primase [Candidatus Phytoplasma luffae]|uniref:DNA primase n=1 Tax=Loofah witches'-broom phytoplasma TaxID=35773 RepID=A0A975FK67_LOWBP|nr:toprim domain-containing protein [Candidatus Phytoplasma luffae]QTX02614.1 DNA primase [Candidatus Phytoplasma luffae]QTX02640.1 DNA primase [Candidatus Phytoplasma luffae]QTX02715.1 DNA primase [Candidatus Phytoplasma luffae]QTX02878.1 DNA primase [Candidatus Phytoplasma luffae]QTX02898.1 DNA primase [Candidatus Phytoplasma luffae]